MGRGNAPVSWRVVLSFLRENEGKTFSPKQIMDILDIRPRTVSFALGKLMKKKLIVKIPNLLDMRQPLYMYKGDEGE